MRDGAVGGDRHTAAGGRACAEGAGPQANIRREGGGGLGPKSLCTKNGPIRFSLLVLSHDGHFGLGGGGGALLQRSSALLM